MRVASRVQARLFGVLGDPVDHSLSPAMQNAAFASTGLPHLYLRYRVPAAALEEAFAEARRLGMGGLNLTVPLKEAALPLCDAITPAARRIGAVNTVVVRGQRLLGDNTDAGGFLRGLASRVRLRGTHAVLIGAGGSARAVGTALVDAGCARLTVANRTPERGETLAGLLSALGCPDARAVPLGALTNRDVLADAVLVVNVSRASRRRRRRPRGGDSAGLPVRRPRLRGPDAVPRRRLACAAPDARRHADAAPSGRARLRGMDRPARSRPGHGARARQRRLDSTTDAT